MVEATNRRQLVAELEAAWGKLAYQQAPSAEGYFVDDPYSREVTELVDPDKATPPEPDEILKLPGGKDFATLNRVVVETEQKGVDNKGLPKNWDEVPKEQAE